MSRAPLFTIEALASAHDRSAFACGVSALDRYFREQVTQDVRRRVGNCFVAVEAATGAVAGFYTLAATSLLLTSIPDDQARRLPRYPTVPAALLARLAVATSFQGNKLGGILLADAIDRVARGDLGAFALVVDAKDAECAPLLRAPRLRGDQGRTHAPPASHRHGPQGGTGKARQQIAWHSIAASFR